MKNLRSDHEVEIRCAQFFKAMEHRVVKLESEIKKKIDEAKVREMILNQEVANNNEMEQATAKIVESVNQKVSDFRDSALREKNIIIHEVDESEAEEGLDKRSEDTEFVINFFEFIETDTTCIKKVIRLGPRKKNKDDNVETEVKLPRPLRVTMSDVDAKQTFMKKLSKLGDVEETNVYKRLSVTYDMSKSEREANKEQEAHGPHRSPEKTVQINKHI